MEDRTFGRITLWVTGCAVIGFLLLASHAYATDNTFGVFFRLAIAALSLPLLWGVSRSGSVRFLRGYILFEVWAITVATVAATGGAESRGLYQFAVVPFLAAGIGQMRLATAGLAVALLSVGAFYAADAAGVVFPHHGVLARTVDMSSLGFILVMFFGITTVVVRSGRMVREDIEVAVRKVDAANTLADGARQRREHASDTNRRVIEGVGDRFHDSLATLSRLAEAVAAALPDALREHATMVARGANDLLQKLEEFVAFARGGEGATAPPARISKPVTAAVPPASSASGASSTRASPRRSATATPSRAPGRASSWASC